MKKTGWILPLALLAMAGCSKNSKTTDTAVPGSKPTAETRPAARPQTRPAAPAARNQPAPARKVVATGNNPKVIMKTSMGDIVVELYPDKAPISVKNFLRYVDEKFYDGTIFHRVIKTFVIQGGGFTPDFKKKPTHEPIKNEADNGLKNLRGTIAMARTMALDSATAQFYINVKDNAGLDHRGPGPRAFGYAVFGKVVKGMDVVDKIRNVATGPKGPFPRDCPLQTVTILSVRRVAAGASDATQPAKAASAGKPADKPAGKAPATAAPGKVPARKAAALARTPRAAARPKAR